MRNDSERLPLSPAIATMSALMPCLMLSCLMPRKRKPVDPHVLAARARWDALSEAERSQATEPARKARAKLSKAQRSSIARTARAAQSSEVTRAAARLAWARRKARAAGDPLPE